MAPFWEITRNQHNDHAKKLFEHDRLSPCSSLKKRDQPVMVFGEGNARLRRRTRQVHNLGNIPLVGAWGGEAGRMA